MSISAPVAGDTQLLKPPLLAVEQLGDGLFVPIASPNLGWNASATLATQLPAAGQLDFYVPAAAVGVIVGLSAIVTDDYAQLTHGLYLTYGVAQAIEGGGLIGSTTSFVDTDKLTIAVSNAGVVTYQKNSATFYTSTIAATGSAHYIPAFLYAAGDLVFNPFVTPLFTGAQSASGTAVAVGSTALGASTPYAGGAATAGAAKARGTQAQLMPVFNVGEALQAPAEAEGSSPLGVAGMGRARGANALGADISTYVTGLASFAPGGISLGSSTTPLPLQTIVAQLNVHARFSSTYALFASLISWLGARSTAAGIVTLPASIVAQLGVLTSFEFVYLFGSIISSLRMSDATGAALNLLESIFSQLSVEQSLIAQQMMSAAFIGRMGMRAPDTVGVVGLPNETWVVNFETSDPVPGQDAVHAATRYTEYDFNSFAVFKGRAYGATDEGIFLLDGPDDNGEPIRASMDFGKVRLSSGAHQRIPAVYASTSVAGRMSLRASYNGVSYLYRSRGFDQDIRMQRFDLGRGMRANYVELELFNGPGYGFDLDTLQFIQVELGRRI